MNWYYAKGGSRLGPLEPADFERLVQQGEITADTLVWREGMPDWQRHGDVTSPAQSGTPPLLPADQHRCVECGGYFAADEVIRLQPGYVCGACKSIVVQRLGEGVTTSAAEEVRKQHLSHEASIRSVGLLYLLGAAAMILQAALLFTAGTRPGLLPGLVTMVLGVGVFFLAIGLRRLRGWARIPIGVLAGIGLLAFPVGTLINGYVLYLIFSRKGATVFSADYQEVIAQTPHIKYRTSIVVLILLGVVVAAIGLGLVIFLARGTR